MKGLSQYQVIRRLFLWFYGEGNGTPLQYSCLENPMDGGAWWAVVHGVAKSRTRLSDFTFTFHFHALEEEMAPHSSVLAWRIPGTGGPGGLPSVGSHRVGHDWSNLEAAAVAATLYFMHFILLHLLQLLLLVCCLFNHYMVIRWTILIVLFLLGYILLLEIISRISTDLVKLNMQIYLFTLYSQIVWLRDYVWLENFVKFLCKITWSLLGVVGRSISFLKCILGYLVFLLLSFEKFYFSRKLSFFFCI